MSKTYRVKNWSQFQHYKDRRPPWIKLHRQILDDPEYFSLADKAARHLPLIWLMASETEDGSLPSVKTMSFRLRISVSECEKIIDGLLHYLTVTGQDDSELLADCLHVAVPEEEERRLEKEKEKEKERLFDVFWSLYPYKIGKPKAKSAYMKAIKTAEHAEIMAGLQKHINCDGWIKDDGKFIPHPTTWLNREGWNDQVIGGNTPSQQASDYERKNREFIERTNRMMDEIN